MTEFLMILFGFLAGIFGGMGMGGGTILIPLLTIFLGLDQKLSQGINLITFLVMALIAIFIHYKNGLISTQGLLYIILPGAIFSALGAFLAGFIPSSLLRSIFGGFLILLSAVELFKVFKK